MALSTLLLVAMLALPSAVTSTVAEKAKQVRITSVESRVEAKKLATPDPKAALRSELEEALDAVDWKREGVVRPFEVIAVLAAAESSASRDGVRASCSVEVVLREPSGAILGRVRGSARGEDRGGARAPLERGVLEAAAQSASDAIPQAVRRSREGR